MLKRCLGILKIYKTFLMSLFAIVIIIGEDGSGEEGIFGAGEKSSGFLNFLLCFYLMLK